MSHGIPFLIHSVLSVMRQSVMDDWACGSKELEEVSIFKESMDRWGDRVNNKSDDESDE